jgi:hypothetical protein
MIDFLAVTFAIQSGESLLQDHFSKFDWDHYFRGPGDLLAPTKDAWKKSETLEQVEPPELTISQLQPEPTRWPKLKAFSKLVASPKLMASRVMQALPSFSYDLSDDANEDSFDSHHESYATIDDRSSLYTGASGGEDKLGRVEGRPLSGRCLALSIAWRNAIIGAANLVREIIHKNLKEQIREIVALEQKMAWGRLASQLDAALRQEVKRLLTFTAFGTLTNNSSSEAMVICSVVRKKSLSLVLLGLLTLMSGIHREHTLFPLSKVESTPSTRHSHAL